MKAILDAGALIALFNKEDQNHPWAKQMFKRYAGPYFTTEPVLTEVAHMTGQDALIVEAIRTGKFKIPVSLLVDAASIERALQAYQDCDLADASIIALSEKHAAIKVLTTDVRHFVKYRRTDKSPIPLEIP